MKCSLQALQKWIKSPLKIKTLCQQATMAGLEVEEVIDNRIIDFSITPNRGDCLSIRGLARDLSAITQSVFKDTHIKPVKASLKDKLSVSIQAKKACPRYVCRVIREVKANTTTPTWLVNALAESGLHTISPIVDVTNYVMLELGQPMHAFDLNTIDKEIKVRFAKENEKILLLNGSDITLNSEACVIADKTKPLALAGIMGGLNSSVTLNTTDILLEAAYFSPEIIAKQRQHYGLTSDSAYRFERQVDYTRQREAMERATQLILEIVGGKAGPVVEAFQQQALPKPTMITLHADHIKRLLGITVSAKDINRIFKSLGFSFKQQKDKWLVTPPTHRSDVALPEDLIEEIARIYGYEAIPTTAFHGNLAAPISQKGQVDELRQALVFGGFHEIISYSFIDPTLQVLLDPEIIPHELTNPMTAEMTTMRTNLWAGLINTFLFNKNRQQQRVRLFEIGTCFEGSKQSTKIGGLIAGLNMPLQWGFPGREVDFYDLKGSVEQLLRLSFPENHCLFTPEAHPALHPGQSAAIYDGKQKIGFLGALHPNIQQKLEVTSNVFLFELDLSVLEKNIIAKANPISKFPEIRRDLALLIKQTIPAATIQDTIKGVVGDWLKDVFIFDVYQGKGIAPGYRSVAIAVEMQHMTRTLTDQEINDVMERIMTALREQLGAELRS